MPARAKKTTTAESTVPVPQSLDEANALAAQIIRWQTTREAAAAQRDQAITNVRGPYDAEIAECSAREKSALDSLETWALANQSLFGANESTALPSGHRVGWRRGNFTATLLRGWTWKQVVEAIKQKARPHFLRQPEPEPNKEALIAARAEAATLAELGVKITQSTSFYVEPNREGQLSHDLSKPATA